MRNNCGVSEDALQLWQRGDDDLYRRIAIVGQMGGLCYIGSDGLLPQRMSEGTTLFVYRSFMRQEEGRLTWLIHFESA